jgi:hypothetical protein
MKLTPKTLYFVLLGMAILAFGVVLAGVYGADSFLKGKSKAVHDAHLNNLVLEQQERQLAKAKADISSHQSLADIAQYIVPQDKDQAQAVLEIVNIAAQNNISLASITFPASSLGQANTKNSQLTPVTGITGVYSLNIVVSSDSNNAARYDDFLSFLNALEHNRRTALVTNIALTPDGKNPNLVSFNLTLQEYVKP